MSKTESALGADEAGDNVLDDVADSTAEIMAEVDEALEEYVSAVEDYTGNGESDPFAVPPDVPPTDGLTSTNGASAHQNGSHEPTDSDVAGRNGSPLPAESAAESNGDEAFFVLPEAIAPDEEVAVADLAAPQARAPVEDDILEELRRADIDGPIVEASPHDDVSAARRRPRRDTNYDPAPIPIPAKPPRLLGRKPRVRKVTRVVRHVDPWSVFKIAILANLVLYVVLMTAGVLLWNVANATGTVDNVERFFESFGWTSFEFDGGQIYHSLWIAGLFTVLGLTGLAVMLATLFNLITDLVGGMRFTVLEEEVVERRTSPMRRFVVRRPEPEVPARTEDASGSLYREAVVDDSGSLDRPTR